MLGLHVHIWLGVLLTKPCNYKIAIEDPLPSLSPPPPPPPLPSFSLPSLPSFSPPCLSPFPLSFPPSVSSRRLYAHDLSHGAVQVRVVLDLLHSLEQTVPVYTLVWVAPSRTSLGTSPTSSLHYIIGTYLNPTASSIFR